MTNPTLCPECGRRPSERVSCNGPYVSHAEPRSEESCPHWTHDVADAALEMLALLRNIHWNLAGGVGAENLNLAQARFKVVVTRDLVAEILARLPEEGRNA